ncbi:glycosyl transferase [Clostridium beijerinckii]|nr:glycosyl transferase [Clostridium beijerinckii]
MIKEDNCNLEKINSKKDLPLVSILLAVYKPNETWFVEQLISLNNQTYDNIELLIYDDCPDYPVDEELIKKHIINFTYNLIRGTKNEGSNKAFEHLTKQGNGEFFSYCDQDDIWEINKIESLVKLIRSENSVLAYSDMSVIDGDGNHIADSLIKVKSRIKYIYGENLFSSFFFKNCVSGCCMLINSKIAKKAVPFSRVTIHDQWLCIVSGWYGKISFVDKPLVKYRIHENNQTGSFKGVYSKKDYYNLRVNILQQRIDDVKRCINGMDLNSDNIDLTHIEIFCDARINKNILKILKYSYLDKKEAYFEIIIKYMPNWLFKILIKKLK